jgi:hypothetical protein
LFCHVLKFEADPAKDHPLWLSLPHSHMQTLARILLLPVARRWNSKQTTSLDQMPNNIKSMAGHNNQ